MARPKACIRKQGTARSAFGDKRLRCCQSGLTKAAWCLTAVRVHGCALEPAGRRLGDNSDARASIMHVFTQSLHALRAAESRRIYTSKHVQL